MRGSILQAGIRFLRENSGKIRRQYNTSASRTLHITGISSLGNLMLGAGKILSGILSLSMFVCINGCYTLGMVLARSCALAGAVKSKEKKIQYRYYRWSGIILILASLFYIVYSVRMYFHPSYTAYHEYVALAIATFTFVEIGINLRGVLVLRKSSSPLLQAIKIINLSASLISLVLTQAAILSFSGETHDMSNNGILGALMGGCAVLLGVYMLYRIKRLENPFACGREKRRIQKLLKREKSEMYLLPVKKEIQENGIEWIQIKTNDKIDLEAWKSMKEQAKKKYQYELSLESEENQTRRNGK